MFYLIKVCVFYAYWSDLKAIVLISYSSIPTFLRVLQSASPFKDLLTYVFSSIKRLFFMELKVKICISYKYII